MGNSWDADNKAFNKGILPKIQKKIDNNVSFYMEWHLYCHIKLIVGITEKLVY